MTRFRNIENGVVCFSVCRKTRVVRSSSKGSSRYTKSSRRSSRDIGNRALPLEQMCGAGREYAAQGCVLVHNRFSDVFH